MNEYAAFVGLGYQKFERSNDCGLPIWPVRYSDHGSSLSGKRVRHRPHLKYHALSRSFFASSRASRSRVFAVPLAALFAWKVDVVHRCDPRRPELPLGAWQPCSFAFCAGSAFADLLGLETGFEATAVFAALGLAAALAELAELVRAFAPVSYRQEQQHCQHLAGAAFATEPFAGLAFAVTVFGFALGFALALGLVLALISGFLREVVFGCIIGFGFMTLTRLGFGLRPLPRLGAVRPGFASS